MMLAVRSQALAFPFINIGSSHLYTKCLHFIYIFITFTGKGGGVGGGEGGDTFRTCPSHSLSPVPTVIESLLPSNYEAFPPLFNPHC
jgi:hypothetical protein